METKEIVIGEKKFIVSELLAKDSDKLGEIEDTTERIVEMIIKCTGMSIAEYNELTVKERSKIMDAITELNGWSDFQQPKADIKS
jgi:hypothetical protein